MKTALVIGGSVMDVIVTGTGKQLFDAGRTQVESIVLSPGGNGLNESMAAAAAGVQPELATAISHDQAGTTLQAILQKQGIHLHLQETGHPTACNVVLAEPDGQRHILTTNDSALRHLSLDKVETDADIVCLSDLFASRAVSLQDAAAFLQKQKERGAVTLADTVTPKNHETAADLSSLLSAVDYFLVNEEDAASLTKETEPGKMMAAFVQNGANSILLKLGSRGVMVHHKGKTKHVRCVANEHCVDTTGCGDCFAGTFVAALAQELPFAQCLLQAMAAGSLATEKPGAATAIQDRKRFGQLLDQQFRYDGWE